MLIGQFSNQKATHDADPHIVSGYWVSLYQRDRTLFGNVGVATGSLEPVNGRLFDIQFDPVTKRLCFKAKYSTGHESGKGIQPGGREARELMTFSGTLTRRGLTGTMVRRDGYDTDEAERKTRESLKRMKEDFTPKTYEEWASYLAPEATW